MSLSPIFFFLISSCISRSDVTCVRSHVFSTRTLSHVLHHAAAQTTWREERDAPFVAGNTVIILSYYRKHTHKCLIKGPAEDSDGKYQEGRARAENLNSSFSWCACHCFSCFLVRFSLSRFLSPPCVFEPQLMCRRLESVRFFSEKCVELFFWAVSLFLIS